MAWVRCWFLSSSVHFLSRTGKPKQQVEGTGHLGLPWGQRALEKLERIQTDGKWGCPTLCSGRTLQLAWQDHLLPSTNSEMSPKPLK